MRVQVAYALRDIQYLVDLELPAGASVADALAAVAGQAPFSELDLEHADIGVFGDRVARDRELEPGDRVDIYRPLATDPREARRQRVRDARTRQRKTR